MVATSNGTGRGGALAPSSCWRCRRDAGPPGRPCCQHCGASRRGGPPPAAPRPRLVHERLTALEDTVSQLASENQRLTSRLREWDVLEARLQQAVNDTQVRAEAVATQTVRSRLQSLEAYCRRRIAELAERLDTEHTTTLRTALDLTARLSAVEETRR